MKKKYIFISKHVEKEIGLTWAWTMSDFNIKKATAHTMVMTNLLNYVFTIVCVNHGMNFCMIFIWIKNNQTKETSL